MVSESQHGESNGWDSPTVQRPDGDRLIVDNLDLYWPKTLKRQRESKKGGAARKQTQGLWLKPTTLCH